MRIKPYIFSNNGQSGNKIPLMRGRKNFTQSWRRELKVIEIKTLFEHEVDLNAHQAAL